MEHIGLYEQTSEFTTEGAGTSEWCTAKKDGKDFFVKKLQKPVYPSQALGLSPEKYQTRVKRFHEEENRYKTLYAALSHNSAGALIVPGDVITYQFHICTIADMFHGNLKPERIHELSPWQRLVLMRTLTLALMDVHKAGIVHGDMKPENLLINQNADTGICKLRLIDFDGSFFANNPPLHFDDILGDMAYWAPEIYIKYDHEDIVLDKQIDNFALGLILHYLWCGSLPDKPSDQTVGQYVSAGNVVKVDTTEVPLVIAKVIEGLLIADPKKRLTCDQAYSVLGVQLKQYPKDIVCLVKDSTKGSNSTERNNSPKTIPGEVQIIHKDTKGNILQNECLIFDGRAEVTVNAVNFVGYRRVGPERQCIRFDRTGVPCQSSVEFQYAKNGADIWTWIISIIVVFIVCLLFSQIIVRNNM